MRTFSELYSDLSEKKFRAVSKAERRKQAIRMARLAKTSSFKLKVAKSKLKVLPGKFNKYRKKSGLKTLQISLVYEVGFNS